MKTVKNIVVFILLSMIVFYGCEKQSNEKQLNKIESIKPEVTSPSVIKNEQINQIVQIDTVTPELEIIYDGSGFNFGVTFKAGHDYMDCLGVGELCMQPAGFFLPCHVSCLRFGNNCTWSVGFNITIFDCNKIAPGEIYREGIEVLIPNFKGDIFQSPSRSCIVISKQVENINSNYERWYVNIPEQNFSNNGNGTYSLQKGISFTKYPIYDNKDSEYIKN